MFDWIQKIHKTPNVESLNVKGCDYACRTVNFKTSKIKLIAYLQKKYILPICVKYFHKALFIECEFLVISQNPIFTTIITDLLKEKNKKNVFVNNLYLIDKFNYDIVDDGFLYSIRKNSNKTKQLNINVFFREAVDSNYTYTTSKNIALSYSNRKMEDQFQFSFIPHSADKIDRPEELKETLNYNKIWDSFIINTYNQSKVWNNEDLQKRQGWRLILAKKIILLTDTNYYIDSSILNDKNVFKIDYENKDETFKNLTAFIEENV